jgi:predicted Holliday junction resolvase-like endonuclease
MISYVIVTVILLCLTVIISFLYKDNSLLKKANNELAKYGSDLQEQLHQASEKNRDITSKKISSEVRLGQISEHLAPFLNNFPYDSKSCRFLGSPIDIIAFDTESSDPAIVFIEIKTGNARLTTKQKLLKNLIKLGKVRFEEYRIETGGINSKTTRNEDNTHANADIESD